MELRLIARTRLDSFARAFGIERRIDQPGSPVKKSVRQDPLHDVQQDWKPSLKPCEQAAIEAMVACSNPHKNVRDLALLELVTLARQDTSVVSQLLAVFIESNFPDTRHAAFVYLSTSFSAIVNSGTLLTAHSRIDEFNNYHLTHTF